MDKLYQEAADVFLQLDHKCRKFDAGAEEKKQIVTGTQRDREREGSFISSHRTGSVLETENQHPGPDTG